MKIVCFILHIVAAIACGVGSVNATSMVSEILYTVSFGLWGIRIGAYITQFFYDN